MLLCSAGYLLTRIRRKVAVFGLPYSVSIEPTILCNLQCPECPTGLGSISRNRNFISVDQYKMIIDQIKRYASTILLHFQGEPMMHKDIHAMVEYATKSNLITEIATNATLISPDLANLLIGGGLKKMVVSIDSPRNDDFGFYRKGANLEDVISGIKNIQQAKKQCKSHYPIIILEMLAFKRNINLIDEFKILGKSLNVDGLRVKTVQVISHDAYNDLPLGTKYSRYKKSNSNVFALKGKSNASCSAPWFKLSITSDGVVVPCCYDKHAMHEMGDAINKTIKEIWRSRTYNVFRENLIKKRVAIPVCNHCPQGRVKLDFQLK